MMKIVITAPRGHMDGLILEEAVKRDNIEVVGTVGPKGRDYIGSEICGVMVYDDIEKIIDKCDLVVDFSGADISMPILEACVRHGKALICGSTGFTEEQNEKFAEASKSIPLLKAANTSYMVNVMMKLLALAAEKLSGLCRVEIIDMHDQNKKDAPSGTARELAEIISEAGGIPYDEIAFHSVRAGDIQSDHTVLFGGFGERLEITHHSYDWRCFARGACEAVIFMEGKGPGMYLMSDVIGN